VGITNGQAKISTHGVGTDLAEIINYYVSADIGNI
jgi:hypothetical protein